MRGVRPSRRVPLMTIVWRRTVGVQQPAPGFGRINTLTWRGARCFLRCFSCFVLSFPLLFPLLSVCASDRPALGQLFPKRKDARRSCLNPSVKGTTATALRASQVSHRTAQPSIVPFFSLFILLLLPRRTGEALMVYVKHLRAHDALWKKRIAFAPKTFVVLLYWAASFACCSLGRLWNRRGTPGKGTGSGPRTISATQNRSLLIGPGSRGTGRCQHIIVALALFFFCLLSMLCF